MTKSDVIVLSSMGGIELPSSPSEVICTRVQRTQHHIVDVTIFSICVVSGVRELRGNFKPRFAFQLWKCETGVNPKN